MSTDQWSSLCKRLVFLCWSSTFNGASVSTSQLSIVAICHWTRAERVRQRPVVAGLLPLPGPGLTGASRYTRPAKVRWPAGHGHEHETLGHGYPFPFQREAGTVTVGCSPFPACACARVRPAHILAYQQDLSTAFVLLRKLRNRVFFNPLIFSCSPPR